MKVLQTLGKKSHSNEGVFAYKRTIAGVVIDPISSDGDAVLLPHKEWQTLIEAVENRSAPVAFRLSDPKNSSEDWAYSIFKDALPKPSQEFDWNGSYSAYVAAIMEHEGTIDLYGGKLEQDVYVGIYLARDSTGPLP